MLDPGFAFRASISDFSIVYISMIVPSFPTPTAFPRALRSTRLKVSCVRVNW